MSDEISSEKVESAQEVQTQSEVIVEESLSDSENNALSQFEEYYENYSSKSDKEKFEMLKSTEPIIKNYDPKEKSEPKRTRRTSSQISDDRIDERLNKILDIREERARSDSFLRSTLDRGLSASEKKFFTEITNPKSDSGHKAFGLLDKQINSYMDNMEFVGVKETKNRLLQDVRNAIESHKVRENIPMPSPSTNSYSTKHLPSGYYGSNAQPQRRYDFSRHEDLASFFRDGNDRRLNSKY